LARQRAPAWTQTRRLPAPPQPRTQAQAAVNAVRNLDLETKVQEDTFRRAIRVQSRRMSRSEYAAVASAATNQFIESFDAPDNPFFRAALRFAPLLLLAPQRRGSGLEAVITDPRVIGGAAVAAIVFFGENRKRLTVAQSISVTAPANVAVNASDRFVADVIDGRGAVLSVPVTWTSSDSGVASINPETGEVTGVANGVAIITATADGIVRRFRLQVP
jgi:uncharacterized protein YjdB